MTKAMYKSLFCLPLAFFALILELLSSGVIYNTAAEPAAVQLETFSYFDTTYFGYTNFAPLFTAIATCAALLLLGVYCGTQWHWFANAAKHFVFGGAAFSLLPLLFGVHGVSTVSILISAALIAELAVIHFLIPEPKEK